MAAASKGFVPRIFVSYSQEDSDFCLQFVQDLRHAFGDEDAVWHEAEYQDAAKDKEAVQQPHHKRGAREGGSRITQVRA